MEADWMMDFDLKAKGNILRNQQNQINQRSGQ
jgi:hypothetical protein